MEITTERAIELFDAYNRLEGYQAHIGNDAQGKPIIVVKAYDIGPKARWNALKNRQKLRKISDAINEAKRAAKARLDSIALSLDMQGDAKAAFKYAQAESKENEQLAELGKQPNEVLGLLRLPMSEINMRATDPEIGKIVELLLTSDLIDGEPSFAAAPPKPS